MPTSTKLPVFNPIIQDLNKSRVTVTIGMDKQAMTTITQRTAQYKSIPRKLAPAMEGIADYVRETMIPYTFTKEGPGWKQLAKRTVRDREALGFGGKHPILKRSGDLYAELTEKSHPKHVEILTLGKNARIEIGGSSQKFIQNQLGRTEQNLPSRPMIPGTGTIPLLDRDRKEMTRIIEKCYQQILNRPT